MPLLEQFDADRLDARQARTFERGRSYTYSHLLRRAVWNLVWLILARWTPPQLYLWRAFLLRLFGAQMASNAKVYGTTRIWYPPNLVMGEHALVGPDVDCYCMARVEIGARAVISQGTHLCTGTHRIDEEGFQLTARPIVIGPRAWIAAGGFVAPGVVVGEGAVLSARGVAFRDLEPWTVYAGNPAMPLRKRLGPGSEKSGSL